MNILKEIADRVAKSWQSTLIGLIIGVLTYMLYHKDLSVTEWGMAVGTVITIKGIFISKDPGQIKKD